jgi:hypothetical protein
MGSEVINIRTLVHHIEHLVLYSLILWQIVFGIRYLLKYVLNNMKFSKKTDNNPIIINSGGESTNVDTKSSKDVKKDLKAIEVDFKKDIFIDKKTDNENIKMDEVIKGKVKTQKNKLKKLRGK